MNKEELIPGLQYALESELARSEIKVVLQLIEGDKDIYELQKGMKIRAITTIYTSIRSLIFKGVIEQYREQLENRRRYKLL